MRGVAWRGLWLGVGLRYAIGVALSVERG